MGPNQSARQGGSGHAHPDEKMHPTNIRESERLIGRLLYVVKRPTSVQRQAAKRKSNAKRRRRDRLIEGE